ncbi:MAG: hypothetical protein LH472_08955 [Pyrinomonadaceae bacterium]|nr:hypothetical protein [Pyrinomonadaceae bacterium]
MQRLISASKIILAAAFLLLAVNVSFAQDDEPPPPSRSISSLDFQTQRPKTAFTNSNNANAPKSAKRRKSIAALGSVKRKYKWVTRVASLRRTRSDAGKKRSRFLSSKNSA